MENVAVGADTALNATGGGIRIEGSSHGNAIITTGEGASIVSGAGGAAKELLGLDPITRIRQRNRPDNGEVSLLQSFMSEGSTRSLAGYVFRLANVT